MHIDTGLVVVVIAVLIFYLRLIIIQRERVRRAVRPSRGSSKKKKPTPNSPASSFSIVSQNKRDWLIAGIGVVLILIGVLLNRQVIHQALAQAYWWLPVSIGIIAFSWLFR